MPRKYPQSFKDRAVWMVSDRLESDEDGLSSYQVIKVTAPKLNISVESLRRWVEQASVDSGNEAGYHDGCAGGDPSVETGERGAAARERDPQDRVGAFRRGARPAHAEMIAYVDMYRDQFGVELICRTPAATGGGFSHPAATGPRGPARSATGSCAMRSCSR